MGRNFTPTAILDARGAFLQGANPARKRPNEPRTDKPLGSPPSWMSKEEKKVWKELAKQALPGVLMQSDRLQFSLLVRIATKLYGNLEMRSSEMSLLVSLGSKFAMNPADRSRVSVEAPKESALTKFNRSSPENSAVQ